MLNRLPQTFEVDAEVAAQSVTIQNTIEGAWVAGSACVWLGRPRSECVVARAAGVAQPVHCLRCSSVFFLNLLAVVVWPGCHVPCASLGCPLRLLPPVMPTAAARGAPSCPWLTLPSVSLPLQRLAAMR